MNRFWPTYVCCGWFETKSCSRHKWLFKYLKLNKAILSTSNDFAPQKQISLKPIQTFVGFHDQTKKKLFSLYQSKRTSPTSLAHPIIYSFLSYCKIYWLNRNEIPWFGSVSKGCTVFLYYLQNVYYASTSSCFYSVLYHIIQNTFSVKQ